MSQENTVTYHWWWTLVELKCKFWVDININKYVKCSHQFSQRKNLDWKVFLQARNVEKTSRYNYGKPDCILSAVRCMYHKLDLLEYSQKSQENWQYRNQMYPSCQKLRKPGHHLICAISNPSMTQHFSTLVSQRPQVLGAGIFEELFKPWVIDTDRVVNITWCSLKAFANFLFDFFIDLNPPVANGEGVDATLPPPPPPPPLTGFLIFLRNGKNFYFKQNF